MSEHFCSCTDLACPKHPTNHQAGCDPCVRGCLRKGEIPSCFFHAVHDDTSGVRDWTMAGFADYLLQHQEAKS